MGEFIQLLVSGAISGAIYSLIAAGLTLSYTSTGIFNLAYGGIAYTSAMLYFQVINALGVESLGMRLLALFLVVFVFCPLLGQLLNVAVFRPLARANDAAKVMATIGILVALPALTEFIVDLGTKTWDWGLVSTDYVFLTPGVWKVPSETWTYDLGSFDLRISSNQWTVLVVAAVIAIALWALMRHTRLGLQMRAVVDRPDLAGLRGVSESSTSSAAWIIGTMLAGLAGVIGAPVFNSLDANLYNVFMFIATAAAVVGGLRSIPLAFAGGVALGVVTSWVGRYATFAQDIRGFESSVPFVVLLGGLLFMARDRTRRSGVVADAPPVAEYTDDLPAWRVRLPWVLGGVFIVLQVLVFADQFWLGFWVSGLALALVFLSWVMLTGLGGMVSLAQAAFVTMAAMTAGLVLNRAGLPFIPALIVGTVIAGVLGVIVALPALRLGGLPLALATLALAFMSERVLFEWSWFKNGQGTKGWDIPRPEIGWFDLDDEKSLAVLLALLVFGACWLVKNLQRSLTGRAIIAVRNSEPAAATSGHSVVRTKLAVFALSALLAGFGGVFYAAFVGNVTPFTATTQAGLFWLAVVVLIGIRRPGGAVMAGVMVAASGHTFGRGWHWEWLESWHVVAVCSVLGAAAVATAVRDRRVGLPFSPAIPGVLAVLAFLCLARVYSWYPIDWDGFDQYDEARNIPAIMFGLGAMQLARQPDGIIAFTAAQNRARRDAWRRRLAAWRGEAEAVGPAPAPSTVMAAPADPPAPSEDAGDQHVAGRTPALELVDVRAGYGLVEALHGIDLTVPRGKITALLGPNGAGKSTTCAVAAGLLPATSGSVRLAGEDVTGLRSHRRARRGVVLAPEARGIFGGLTVRENMQLWLPRPEDRELCCERFPILGDRQNQLAGNLSGGEQQILTLAPLLANPPEVLIADEPSLGLAPLIVNQILELFIEFKLRGVALLLVEEKARDVLEIADSVAFISLGHITWHGSRSDVDHSQLDAAYLGEATSS
ncbi:ABC transporter permease subunit [Candidatus Poriferisocius sp.]|uniref:ABC transporter permease subunit n=1 Tax=Candidatus Poriferisocius sp. TaxID=3101276 RepID=UPI003B5B24B9